MSSSQQKQKKQQRKQEEKNKPIDSNGLSYKELLIWV